MSKTTTPATSRLEEGLRFWEEMTRLIGYKMACRHGAGLERKAPSGPWKHWPEFRQFLLNYRKGDPFPRDRFYDLREASRVEMGSTALIPSALANWTADSRRIFSVDGLLQRELALTSLGNFKFNEIVWPFDTFALALTEPLRVAPNGPLYDSVIVTRTPIISMARDRGIQGEILQFHFFGSELAGYPSLTPAEVEKIDSRLRAKRWKECAELALATMDQKNRSNAVHYCFEVGTEGFEGESIERFIADMAVRASVCKEDEIWGTAQNQCEFAQTMLRTLFGFMLYLSSISSSSPELRRFAPRPGTETPKLGPIHHGADVCLVTSDTVLTPYEREILGDPRRSFAEISIHFRRGHWRKRPGTAIFPLAPKNVKVKPCRIKFGHLLPDSQPGGLEQKLG